MGDRLHSVDRRHWSRFLLVGTASLTVGVIALLVRQETPRRVHADEPSREIYNETLVPPRNAPKLGGIRPVAAAEETVAPATISPELPAPLQPIAQSMDVPSPPCNCGKTASDYDSPLYVSAFGGASYFDTSSDTSFGGMYGMHLAYDLNDRLGVMSMGLINNYSGGSQYFGMVGGYLLTDYYGDKWDRFGPWPSISSPTPASTAPIWLRRGTA
jgi:hypothetical protein